MWRSLIQQLEQTLGTALTGISHQTINGGCINKTHHLRSEQGQWFIKVNEKCFLPHFRAEVAGLTALAAAEQLRVPEVVLLSTSKEQAILVLEWLSLSPGNDSCWLLAGQHLARQHEVQLQAEYGFDEDNYLGEMVQPNPWQRNWATFFSEQRLGWQLQLAAERGYRFADIDVLVTKAHAILKGHQPQPSLVHGDLWQGNIGFAQGEPVVFDPACYWGDAEVDLAYSELFDSFPRHFYLGYQQIRPIDSGYSRRKPLYNLYHLLNHLNHFGEAYLQRTAESIGKLAQA